MSAVIGMSFVCGEGEWYEGRRMADDAGPGISRNVRSQTHCLCSSGSAAESESEWQ